MLKKKNPDSIKKQLYPILMKNSYKILLIIYLLLQLPTVGAQVEKKNTASPNVSVLKQEFVLSTLNQKSHKIWIYLPPDYSNTTKRFPVIYMHDGQNLFSDHASYLSEWGVDETLNRLYKKTGKGYIVIGIENAGEERTNEYTPWTKRKDVDIPDFPDGGGGALYMDFIVNIIKPYIDTTYRTKPDRDNTGLIGSSLGGLISFYGALEYPEIFGKIGALSPSFWFSNKVWPFATSKGRLKSSRMYLLIGEKEPAFMVSDTKKMYDLLLLNGYETDNLVYKSDPEGAHEEPFWGRTFAEVIEWLFSN